MKKVFQEYSNIQLVLNNARLAAQTACALSAINKKQ